MKIRCKAFGSLLQVASYGLQVTGYELLEFFWNLVFGIWNLDKVCRFFLIRSFSGPYEVGGLVFRWVSIYCQQHLSSVPSIACIVNADGHGLNLSRSKDCSHRKRS